MKSSRNLLFVVSMHRSGSSALCSALEASGATFGSCLLQPMSGVNDEGFWEDGELVEINEQLLHKLDTHWYTVSPDLAAVDWSGELFSSQREQARVILNRGFGDGSLEAVKDPRLCITLPFWLSLCDTLQINTSVCVINRSPLEIARSLEKRDGFPVGYGLRLYSTYRKLIAANVPDASVYLSYKQLLQGPLVTMRQLSETLPLSPQKEALAKAVRHELQHQNEEGGCDVLVHADCGTVDFEALDAAIEASFPLTTTVEQLSCALVACNGELTRVGDTHTVALATLAERDATLEAREATLLQLGAEHTVAQKVLDERDEQIVDLDKRLTDIGSEHSHALQVVTERDQQLRDCNERASRFEHRVMQMEARLARILKLPGLGFVFRKLWFYERR